MSTPTLASVARRAELHAEVLAAYTAELEAHMPTRFVGRHACSCGWLSDRPTDRGGAIAYGRHITAAEKAAQAAYAAAMADVAAATHTT